MIYDEKDKKYNEWRNNPKLSDYMNTTPPKPKKVLVTDDKKKLTEDQVVAVCVAYLKKQGWKSTTLYTGGIPLSSGSMASNPAKGIPDTICFNLKLNRCIWIEYKKSHGGLLSTYQETWIYMIRKTGGTAFVVNSLKSLKDQYYETFGEHL